MSKADFDVPADLGGKRLDAALKVLSGHSWNEVRRLIGRGKVSLDAGVCRDAATPVAAGSRIHVDPSAPRQPRVEGLALVHVDADVVVVHKPAGVSTVPFGDEPPDQKRRTLDALVRDWLAKKEKRRASALGVVQRLDKETSGVMLFARNAAAKRALEAQFRAHSIHRVYQAIAHGEVGRASYRSRLVKDRGDGLRGSTDNPELGRLAVTHVAPIAALRGATHLRCRLETGRTHQIRIHLSEAGHPLAGERVYIRGYDGPRITAPRLMLHAAELGFDHPRTSKALLFQRPPPDDFAEVLARLTGT